MNGNGVADLAKKFRGYTFRHFEDAKCDVLRWQAGRIEVERIIVLEQHNHGTVDTPVELEVEKFHLLAFGTTESELIERLEELPSVAPTFRELIE